MNAKRILIVAGEASGDLLGANLVEALRPHLGARELFGLGGIRMAKAGVELVDDVSQISVVGVSEVLRVYPRARRMFKRLVARVREERPELAILIDFPEFNMRLAPVVHALGVPVVYYVSPQVWAWRQGRAKTLARYVRKMLVFFPFEVDFYSGKLDVIHVGHPLVEEVPELAQAWDGQDALEGPLRLCLLPGSRRSETKRLLAVQLGAARLLRETHDLRVTVIVAPTVDRSWIERELDDSGLDVQYAEGEDRFAAIAQAHVALCASGTATLEVGLLRTPMVVVYRVGPFSQRLGQLLVKIPYISLVNLVMGCEVVPELLQANANPERIAAEVRLLLNDARRRRKTIEGLSGLRQALGAPGASGRAAAEIAKLLEPEDGAVTA